MRILVVEDDHTLRRAITRVLSSLKWSALYGAENPFIASTLSEVFDVIVTDWNMPHGGGAKILELFDPRRVIIYSSDIPKQISVFRVLTKPCDTNELRKAVVDCANQKL